LHLRPRQSDNRRKPFRLQELNTLFVSYLLLPKKFLPMPKNLKNKTDFQKSAFKRIILQMKTNGFLESGNTTACAFEICGATAVDHTVFHLYRFKKHTALLFIFEIISLNCRLVKKMQNLFWIFFKNL
jgi:hypothetical protein